MLFYDKNLKSVILVICPNIIHETIKLLFIYIVSLSLGIYWLISLEIIVNIKIVFTNIPQILRRLALKTLLSLL